MMKPYYFTALLWLAFCQSASCLTEERKQELIRRVSENSIYDCKYLPAEEKEFLKGVLYEINRRTNNPEARDYQLLQIGDEPTLERRVKEYQETGVNMDGFPAASGQARFIEVYAPAIFSNEPYVYSGGDTPGPPLSYGMTYPIIRLLRESPQLSPEVRHWALSLNADEYQKNRAILQKWWKENERQFKERDYLAVKPPLDQSPPPLLPDNPSPSVNDSRPAIPPPPDAILAAVPKSSSFPGVLIAALCAILLAGALWLVASRDKSRL